MKRVLLLLGDGFEAYEAASFTDVLGFATAFGKGEEIEVITAGLHAELHCTFGFTVVPTMLVKDVKDEDFDAMAVPGGFELAGFYNDAYSEEFSAIIRRFAAAGKPIVATCTGVLAVAKAGVLENRRATTYPLLEGTRRKQLAELGAIVVDAPLVREGQFVTSTSPATAPDVAFALLEMLTSEENAVITRHTFGYT